MKISLEWLTDFVQLKTSDPIAIAERITVSTGEVEEVIAPSSLVDGCVVGKIVTVERHPNADRLSLCDVQTDRGIKRVVCGGTNVRPGMKVAFAPIGARVRWHGTEMMTLEPATIRGEKSEGMICAAEELDLSDRFPAKSEKEIIDLGDGDKGVGTPLADYLDAAADTVLHIDNHAITHRPDLFSHVGMAREIVALGLGSWKKHPVVGVEHAQPLQHKKFPKTALPFSINNKAGKLVPRYAGCLIEIDALGQTPDWMKKRLEATGWRSVNVAVDITNYVMMETGMPLHAFDADDIRGDVALRTAKPGERITTLDGETLNLPEGALVLNDDDGIFDLVGIMGGLRSSTKESTRRIYIQAIIPDAMTIRRAVIATGQRTDAATIFEKDVPPASAEIGLVRAIELFLHHVPGARVASSMMSWGTNPKPKPITVSLDHIDSVLGATIAEKDATKILEDLGCAVSSKKIPKKKSEVYKLQTTNYKLVVTPPAHRIGDLHTPQDVIEEIGRIYGYDKIEPVLPTARITPPQRDHRLRTLRTTLKEETFFELVPLSLVSPSLLKKTEMDPHKAVAIQNPLGEELSLLQPSTLPALLEHAQRTIGLAGETLRTFSWGHIFSPHDEHGELGLLHADLRPHNETKRSDALRTDPFLTLKRTLTDSLKELGYSLDIRPTSDVPAFAHPGRIAILEINRETVGTLFEVHPIVRSRFDLPGRTAAALIDLSALLAIEPHTMIPRPLPLFPSITYDHTITATPNVQIGDLREELKAASPLLEAVTVEDLYAGKPLPEGQYNVTLRFYFRANDRTLTEEEVKREMSKMEGIMRTRVSE